MILLIQFRTDQSGPHEIKAVDDAMSVRFNQLAVINARSSHVDKKKLKESVKAADVVLLGGCGENGYENADESGSDIEKLKSILRPTVHRILADQIPTLGLCFGHQLLADMQGGAVGLDESETGIAKLEKTHAADEDNVFSGLPSSFYGVVGHKASVIEKPDEAVNLVQSDTHTLQALRYGDHVYTTQFHPELNKQGLHDRLQLYPEYEKNKLDTDHEGGLKAQQILTQFLEIYH